MSSAARLWSGSEAATIALGEAIGRAAREGDVIALHGELGAGKTQLVRGIAAGMGLSPRQVSSPTFVISHEYLPDDAAQGHDAGGGLVLVHIDAYRLTGPDDLGTIGWSGDGGELREGAVIVIEWAERVAGALGADVLHLTLEHADAGRRITLEPGGVWSGRGLGLGDNDALRPLDHE